MAKRNSEKMPLTLLGAESVGIQPPFALGKHGRSLWDRIQSEYHTGIIAGPAMRP